jgi:putative oxidoreductase
MAIVTLGRIIFGAYFIYSGFGHFKNEKGLTGYAKSKGVPSARTAVLLTGAMLIVGGLGVLLNSYVSESATLLLIFLIPTTLMMHAFWRISDPMHKMSDQVNFFKNLALIGALLMLAGGFMF